MKSLVWVVLVIEAYLKRSYNFKGAGTFNKVSQEDENSYCYLYFEQDFKTAKYVRQIVMEHYI
jgi:hypothetical protein